MVKARKIKNTKKRQALTSEVCSLAAKYFLSNRQVYEMVGAATAEHNLEDKNSACKQCSPTAGGIFC